MTKLLYGVCTGTQSWPPEPNSGVSLELLLENTMLLLDFMHACTRDEVRLTEYSLGHSADEKPLKI